MNYLRLRLLLSISAGLATDFAYCDSKLLCAGYWVNKPEKNRV
jgi:hypothetical protein